MADDLTSRRMLEKVRALLAKAEASPYAEEAESFSAKAHELMARYSIERALLDGTGYSAGPGHSEIHVPDPYARAKFAVLDAVAVPNRCQAVFDTSAGVGHIVGFPSDLEAVEVLYTSLLLQATRQMAGHGSVTDAWGRNRTRSFRNSFLHGFAAAVGARFEQNRQIVEADVATDDLPVLVGRSERVDDALAERFPHVRSIRSSVSNGAGVRAGHRAGSVADIGTDRLAGESAALGM